MDIGIWQEKIERFLDKEVRSIKPVSSSASGHTFRLQTAFNNYFVKIARTELIHSEHHGLSIITQSASVRIPKIFGYFSLSDDYSALILECIEKSTSSPPEDHFKKVFKIVSDLHKAKSDQFGLDQENHIGALRQLNTQSDSWSQFFISCRLEYMWEQALMEKSIPNDWTPVFDKYVKFLADHLESIIVTPSLLHGDLWSGNMLTDENHNPVLIDPAVYYGHEEVDFAMMDLFGGFESKLFEEYHMSKDVPNGFEIRKKGYQLYYLLVHVRLFGAAYLNPVYSIIQYPLK